LIGQQGGECEHPRAATGLGEELAASQGTALHIQFISFDGPNGEHNDASIVRMNAKVNSDWRHNHNPNAILPLLAERFGNDCEFFLHEVG
jgi:hypothetical protein